VRRRRGAASATPRSTPTDSGSRKARAALLELHLRLHDLGRGILDELDALEDERQVVAAWPKLLDRLVDEVLANRDLFRFHQRNERALHTLTDTEQHRADNDDLAERFRRLLGNPAIPLADRVRMTCSVTAVLGGLMAGDDLYGDEVPIEELAAHVPRGDCRTCTRLPQNPFHNEARCLRRGS
jgi:hypothetical protein